jgi:hypothetical protein
LFLPDLLDISVAKETGAYQSGAPDRLSTIAVSSWLYQQVLDKHLKYCQGITLSLIIRGAIDNKKGGCLGQNF